MRQDLCTRHRERHTNRGSQLQRKDSFPVTTPQPAAHDKPQDSSSPESTLKEEDENQSHTPISLNNPVLRGTVTSTDVAASETGITASASTSNPLKSSGERAKIRRTIGDHGISRSLSSLESSPGVAGRRYSVDHTIRSKTGSVEDYGAMGRDSSSTKSK